MKIEKNRTATSRTELTINIDEDFFATILDGQDGTLCLLRTSTLAPWMNRDDARQLAAILLHFAETGELKGGEDG